jgi:purine-binding chemotaxis protein CheW
MSRVRSKYTHPDYHFTCFKVGGFKFGISLNSVREVTRCRTVTRVKDCPSFIDGVIRLRSITIPVVDMRRILSVAPVPSASEMIIIVSIAERVAGLIVDEVSDVITGGKKIRPRSRSIRNEPFDSFIEVVLETGDGLVRVISLENLFTEDELELLGGRMPGGTGAAHGW